MGKTFIFTNCKPRQEAIEEFERLKQHEEASKHARHVISEIPPPSNAPLSELRDYAARHGYGEASYLLDRRQLVRLLELD